MPVLRKEVMMKASIALEGVQKESGRRGGKEPCEGFCWLSREINRRANNNNALQGSLC